MNLKKIISNNKLIIFTILAYIGVLSYDNTIFKEGLANTGIYLKEMLEVMPAVFVVSALISVWVPREVIMNNFGSNAGIRGKLMSVFIGSISAGPIYAAFPIAQSLLNKGASIANVIIIISAWAVVKVPMFIVETKFLGLSFAVTRYLLTVPGILVIGYLADKLLNCNQILIIANEEEGLEEVVDTLPGFNCGSCGFDSCTSYAKAIINEQVKVDLCAPGGREVEEQITQIIEADSLQSTSG